MSTIHEPGGRILDALAFANISTLRELRAQLGRIEPAATSTEAPCERTMAPRRPETVAHAATPMQGAL